jgi:hypothetical protein
MSARAPGEAVTSAAELAPPADYTLVSDELTTLDAATLPRDRPVTLGLSLPVASANRTALAATIVDESGRRLDAKAAVQGTENQSAYLEIDSSWLAPGTYLIHLTTNEPSHLPLRRYPLVVR